MIRSVCFLSRQAIENHLKARKGMAIISITDTDAPPARLPKGVLSLRLSFEDLSEESLRVPAGYFPDMLMAPLAVTYDCYTLPDGYHAQKIVDFIRRRAASPYMHDIVAHCEAGISRSAAVAQFVALHYGVPIDQANPDTSAANARLLRLLNKAINDEEFTLKPSITGFKRKEPERHREVYRGIGIF